MGALSFIVGLINSDNPTSASSPIFFFNNNSFSRYMKKTNILITLLAAVTFPAMSETLSLDISDGFVTVRTPENETRTINAFTATDNYNASSTCLIEFKGEMQSGTWKELPAGTVINNAEIKHDKISLSLVQGVHFTNNSTIDLSYDPWDETPSGTGYQTINMQQSATFVNNGSVTASLYAQNNSEIIASDGSEFFGEIQLGYAESDSYASLMIGGAVTMSLSDTLDVNNGSLIFTEGSSLDMKGGAITLGDTSSIVYRVDGIVNENSPIVVSDFILNATGDTDWVVTVEGSDGTSYTTTMSALTIPEPSVATLSLLALAGLAARRRRR